ncbi:MAG: hypothetical protein GY754_00910 [bacterium]|nr:hypothetical protein [bacterium]
MKALESREHYLTLPESEIETFLENEGIDEDTMDWALSMVEAPDYTAWNRHIIMLVTLSHQKYAEHLQENMTYPSSAYCGE